MRLLPHEGAAHTVRGAGSACAPVGALLLAYASEVDAAGIVQTGAAFTPDPREDAFIKGDPNAFLIGVLFTQGIPAERAWAGPARLAERLGHFDVRRLAEQEARIGRAIAQAPALHRFVRTLPRWIASAARRIASEYDGDARHIWREGSHVLQVTERLLAFDGIGPKKAAMTVDLLTNQMGVQLRGREDTTVAYDVHVRRVFLRTGLASEDAPGAITAAARAVCPECPGRLDLAAWLIGRRWCFARTPSCDACVLAPACPRLPRTVESVGVRRQSSS